MRAIPVAYTPSIQKAPGLSESCVCSTLTANGRCFSGEWMEIPTSSGPGNPIAMVSASWATRQIYGEIWYMKWIVIYSVYLLFSIQYWRIGKNNRKIEMWIIIVHPIFHDIRVLCIQGLNVDWLFHSPTHRAFFTMRPSHPPTHSSVLSNMFRCEIKLDNCLGLSLINIVLDTEIRVLYV